MAPWQHRQSLRTTARITAALAIGLSLTARAQANPIEPGRYMESGHPIYVGVRHEMPDPLANDFFDPISQRTGDLHATQDLHTQTGISEDRRIIKAPEGQLGFSLYSSGKEGRATVILIHGNDAEGREMGFIPHQLIVSQSGYNGDATLPERFVRAYPQVMIDWLRPRGFTNQPLR
jgi:hypothetical protein